MENIWERVDTRIRDPKGRAVGQRNSKLMFELNHTMPQTEEYFKIFIVNARFCRLYKD